MEQPQTAADAARRSRTLESLRRYLAILRDGAGEVARAIDLSRKAIRESRRAIEDAPED